MGDTLEREPSRAIYVETMIAADMDRVWQLTQATELHRRWDARFSRIRATEELPSGGYRFRYERRIPGHTVTGTGMSIAGEHREDGSRTSAMRFDTSDPLSPLSVGRGYWRYEQADGGIRLSSGYDYEPGFGVLGALVDRLIARRIVGWMTAVNFELLRIWAETGTPPSRWSRMSTLALWRSDRPRASRCVRSAPGHRAMTNAPETFSALAAV